MEKFKESKLAHKYLDGLKGIEIGGAAHNPFGLNTINVDINGNMDSNYKKKEIELCGEALKVDKVAPGDELPFDDKSYDFIIASHVLEQFFDPIKTLIEWNRVAGKYIFLIIPHKERTFYKEKELTTVEELEKRHNGEIKLSDNEPTDEYHTIWNTETFKNFIEETMGFKIVEYLDVDDKVGNGFCFVLETINELAITNNEDNTKLPSDVVIEQIAKACHEANREYCISIGDNSQPEWDNAENWQKESAVNGVKYHILNPDVTPEDSHTNWMKQKEADGWKYGKVKDVEKKEHPCMLPYNKLPDEQKEKDALFIKTIRSLTGIEQND